MEYYAVQPDILYIIKGKVSHYFSSIKKEGK